MKILILVIFNCLIFGNSGGPGQGYAHNAPNYNNCTSCHSGTTNSGSGSVIFTDLPDYYIPGETYEIGVSVTGDHERGYGFQAIAQNGNNIAGQISLSSNSTQF